MQRFTLFHCKVHDKLVFADFCGYDEPLGCRDSCPGLCGGWTNLGIFAFNEKGKFLYTSCVYIRDYGNLAERMKESTFINAYPHTNGRRGCVIR